MATTKSTSAKKSTAASSSVAVDADIIRSKVSQSGAESEVKITKDTVFIETAFDQREVFKARPVIDPHSTVLVRNGFQGKLVYRSRRTGEVFVWNGFGDEQEMEVQELRNAKGSDKAFFAQNWFLFDDPEVIDYLGVGTYYKNALSYDEFDELFDKTAEEIGERVERLSAGQKKSVAYRAAQLIASGDIDSRKKIVALERSTGIELIER